MDETGIGRAFNLQLQAAPGFTVPGDTAETSRYFREDLVEPGVVLGADGYIAMPSGPGVIDDATVAQIAAAERAATAGITARAGARGAGPHTATHAEAQA